MPRYSALVRVVRWFVSLGVGLEVLYVVAANLCLAYGGVATFFVGTESIKAEVVSGWTVIPGVIHARGVRITYQDHNVQTLIQLDSIEVALSLPELSRRVFHATRVQGEGLVFRFRHRVQPEEKGEPRVQALPPIPGFEDPPVFRVRIPEPPIPDAGYRLWKIQLQNVNVQIKELWVQQFRYLGHGRASGTFELEPARRLKVGSAALALDPGRVLVAGTSAFTEFAGQIDCTVLPLDVRVSEGLAVLRNISAHTQLTGNVAGVEWIKLFLPPNSDTQIEQMGAHLTIDTDLRRGVLAPSSRISLAGDTLRAGHRSILVEATGPWSIVAIGEPKQGGGRVEAKVSRGHLSWRGRIGPRLAIRGVVAGVSSTGLDTTGAWAVRSADLALDELVAPDLGIFSDFPLGGLRLRSGSGVLHGRGSYSKGILSGAAALNVREAVAEVAETQIRGAATLNVAARAFQWGRGTGSFDLGLRGKEISFQAVSGGAACPWGRFATAEANASLTLLPLGRVSGKIDASLIGGKISWGDVRVSGDTDVRATIKPEGSVEGDASRVVGILRTFHLRVSQGAGPPKRWSANVPEAVVDASLLLRSGMFEGPVEITARRVRAVIGKVSLSTDVRARLLVDPLDPMERSGTVSGSVNVTRAAFSSGERNVQGWWAKIGVSPTYIAATQDVELEGRVSARMRDGLPALLALSERGEIPEFIPDVLPLHGLVGTLDVRRHCRLTDIQFSRVEGGPLVASGRVQNVPGETRGAVLVQVSGIALLSAGVSLGELGGVSLFAGEDWLAEQGRDLALASSRLTGSVCLPPKQSVCE